jgi:hypothetical protein
LPGLAAAARGYSRPTAGTYHYEIGEKDASVFFALSLEKAIFVPGIVEHANFRTAEFLRDGAEIESWTRVIETVMRGKLI